MYKHVLLATDLSPTTHSVAEEAYRQAVACDAKLSIVFVIEPISTYAFPLIADQGVAKVQHAENSITDLCDELEISVDNKYTRTGSPKNQILTLADELAVDLIVIGSHGHNGLAKLLGSTATGVVQGSQCSVLVSRVS